MEKEQLKLKRDLYLPKSFYDDFYYKNIKYHPLYRITKWETDDMWIDKSSEVFKIIDSIERTARNAYNSHVVISPEDFEIIKKLKCRYELILPWRKEYKDHTIKELYPVEWKLYGGGDWRKFTKYYEFDEEEMMWEAKGFWWPVAHVACFENIEDLLKVWLDISKVSDVLDYDRLYDKIYDVIEELYKLRNWETKQLHPFYLENQDLINRWFKDKFDTILEIEEDGNLYITINYKAMSDDARHMTGMILQYTRPAYGSLYSVRLHSDSFEFSIFRIPVINQYFEAPLKNHSDDFDVLEYYKL